MRHSIVIGDLLSVTKGLIVHGCNAHGVMGSGVAHQIRTLYPECYVQYEKHIRLCNANRVNALGTVQFYEDGDLIIANAITQQNYGRDGKRYVSYRAIQKAFEQIAMFAASSRISEVNFPCIGAGLGGGDWSIIYPLITSYLDRAGLDSVLWIQD